ncbi:unnamed protein product [Paramecium primaurelia]|uniref:Protein kinase domain-containing protein n=1 Tax=Paramecium primaurelia TaxID=5886 RepID=A0A8S1NGG5_PARPR|nr:unnamed protein product [Paramecium primaurelia]
MICHKKYLIFKEPYTIELHSNKIVLQNIAQKITHILQLEQGSVVDWKLDKKDCKVLALGIQIDNKWEYFYMKQQNLTLLKDFLDGKVLYYDIFKLYLIIGFLGKGAFGKVFKCQNKYNGRILACKSLRKSSKYNEKDFINEVQCMQNLKHPNLVQLKEFSIEQNYFYILMEYVEGETLKNLIKNNLLDEKEKIIIVQQLLSLVNYFHLEGYIYRDFKPENILFIENNVNKLKLIDFGLTIKIDEIVSNKYQVCGTLGYIAPEVFQRTYKYDFKSDIFSLGALIYELFSGIYLLQNCDSQELQNMSKKFQINKEILSNIKNQTIQKLLYGMLQEDPDQRINSREAIDIFKQGYQNCDELLTTNTD